MRIKSSKDPKLTPLGSVEHHSKAVEHLTKATNLLIDGEFPGEIEGILQQIRSALLKVNAIAEEARLRGWARRKSGQRLKGINEYRGIVQDARFISDSEKVQLKINGVWYEDPKLSKQIQEYVQFWFDKERKDR